MKPSVSVVIPTYNSAAGLTDAIESVRDQGWARLEILVVDDGSTDETPEVISQNDGNDLIYLRQANGGPALARNAGVQAAKGEWIAFLDADDRWLPDKLALQFEAIEREPAVAFCYGDVQVREADGSEHYVDCTPSPERLVWELLLGNRLATPTVIIRRDCFSSVGMFKPELRSGEDWDLWLRLASRVPYVGTEKALAFVQRSAEAKYSVEMVERCTFAVLSSFFSDCGAHFPEGTMQEKRVYAWHHSVFARSYLQHGQLKKCLHHAMRAIRAHPSGLRCLTRQARSSLLSRTLSASNSD